MLIRRIPSSCPFKIMALLIFFFFFISLNGSNCLRLTTVDVPAHPIAGESVPLKCMFDMEGDELYSVKWYKGGYEFYRYLPKDEPPAQVYEASGVKVDRLHSDQNVVILESLTLQSSGIYRCEVSAEAPSFDTVHSEKEMMVIALPPEGPRITGGREKYQVGENLRLNCTSQRSKPAAMLEWTINGGKVLKDNVREYIITIEENDELETSILGLEFQVKETHFKDGLMRLRCTATISPVYHRKEETIISDNYHQQGPVMESRETLSQSQTRRNPPNTANSVPASLVMVCTMALLCRTL